MAKEKLQARARRRDDELDDELQRSAAARWFAPGKLQLDDAHLVAAPLPGKRTRDADAIGALDWASQVRIDRRAEHGSDEVDDGALASAFEFIDATGAGAPLPRPLAARLARELGVDLSRVRIHTDARAAEAAAAIGARAFTIGEDIYFAAGAYDPHGDAGVRLLAHEVAHVAQNYRGTAPTGPGVSRPGDSHEQAADGFAAWFAGVRDTIVDAVEPVAQAFMALAPTRHAHRKADDEPAGIEDRWNFFVTNHETTSVAGDLRTKDVKKKARFGWRNGTYTSHYRTTSKESFKREDYTKIVRARFPGEWSADLQTLFNDHGSKLRLSRVDDEGSHRYVWTEGPEPYQKVVLDLHRVSRAAPDPNKQWAFYSQAVIELQEKTAKISLKHFTKNEVLLDGGAKLLDPDAAPGGGKTTEEADEFRHKLVESIVASARYKVDDRGQWTKFYEDFCESELFKGNPSFTGNCFETLVERTIKTLDKERPIFDHPDIGRETADGGVGGQRKGDNQRILGDGKNIVVECKAVGRGGPSQEHIAQMRDYNQIVKLGIIGYLGTGKGGKLIKPNKYSHVTYIFPIQEVAQEWYPDLREAFDGDTKRFSTVPSHDGKSVSVLLKANPEFMIHLEGDGPKYKKKNPPIHHTGMTVKGYEIELEKAGVPKIKGGSTLDVELDIPGAVNAPPEPMVIAPAGDKPGDVHGNLPNPVIPKKATSKLDQLLGKVKTDVRLTDKGVVGTLTLDAGKKIVPGIAIGKVAIEASYEEGKLGAKGTVQILHQPKDGEKKFDVDLEVAWDGVEWSFKATTHVAKDLLEGLSEFELDVSYKSGKWRIASPGATYKPKPIGGVQLEGRVKDLVIDPDNGKVDATAYIGAELGAFGKASADATIKDGKLQKAVFQYDSPDLIYPKPPQSPIFTGAVGGTVIYEDGNFSGRIRGDAKLAIAGLKAINDKGEIGLKVDASVERDGKFGGTIESTTPLQFGKHFSIPKLKATIDDHGDVSADFTVQVTGFKNVPDAHMKARIDKDGFHVLEGSITITFGDAEKDRVWGTVSATYLEGEGLVITGLINAKIKDGMIGSGWMTYSTKTGTADAGLMVSRIPLLDVDKKSKKLVDFDKQIVVFTFCGITLFIDTRFTLEFLFGLKLGITPSVRVKGIDFDDLSFQEAKATIEVDGDISAELVASPEVGLGLALLHPDLVSGSVGLSIPITAGAHINPQSTLEATYDKDGGLTAGASLGLALNFGITGAVVANARANVLLGAWTPHWSKELTSFTIMEPRELFNWTLDLGAPIKPKDDPLPAGDSPAPMASTPRGSVTPAQTPKSGAPPKPTGDIKGTDKSNGVGGVTEFLPQLKKIPEYQTLDEILHEAIELWDTFAGVVADIKNAVKEGLVAIKNGAEWAGEQAWEGLKWTGGKIAWVGGKIGDLAEGAWDMGGDLVDGAGGVVSDIGSGIRSLF